MTRLAIPLPFPRCASCDQAWGQSRHHICGGGVDVEPLSGAVVCTECLHGWRIWESDFLCSCGAIFSASEIEDALGQLLDDCRELLFELQAIERARDTRRLSSESSARAFIYEVAKSVGRATGMVIETLVRLLFRQ